MKVKQVIKILKKDGWYLVKTRGFHRRFKHPTKPGKTTVPGKLSSDIKPGILNSISQQSQINF